MKWGMIGAALAASAMAQPASALQFDLKHPQAEISAGITDHKTTDNYLGFRNDFSEGHALRALIGIPFKRHDNNQIVFEIGAMVADNSENFDVVQVLGAELPVSGELELSGFLGGLKFARHVYEDTEMKCFVIVRIGGIYWDSTVTIDGRTQVEVEGQTVSIVVDQQLTDTGLGAYGGIGLEAAFGKFFIGGDFTYYPIKMSGNAAYDLAVTSVNLGFRF